MHSEQQYRYEDSKLQVEQGKDEVLIGGKEVLAVYLKRLWPGLYNWVIRRREIT